jgi:hypothetical protein
MGQLIARTSRGAGRDSEIQVLGVGAVSAFGSSSPDSTFHLLCEASLTMDEPPSQDVGSVRRRPAVGFAVVPAGDQTVRETLRAWLQVVQVLGLRSLSKPSRVRLQDGARICEELYRVLGGAEPGDGPASDRTVILASSRGHAQAISSMFACPRGTYIEFLVSAPWNALRSADPPDPRTVRGAGTCLVSAAVAWSRDRGCGGRVSLCAENARARAFYEGLGFQPVAANGVPSSFVPRALGGWSSSGPSMADGGRPSEADQGSLMLYDPGLAAHAGIGVPATHLRRAGGHG